MGAYRGYIGPGVKEFPKIRGTLFGGPHSKDYSISGSTLVRVSFFCCLVVFVVWAFRVFFFAVCEGACFFLLFGRGAFFFAVWAGGVFLLLFGGRVNFVAVWAEGVFFFLLFGRGACFFCCLGGGREFTHLPVCLARL